MKSVKDRSSLRMELLIVSSALIWIAGCSGSNPPLTGDAHAYADAQDMFSKGYFDRVVEIADKLGSGASGPYTERSQTVRAVIYGGEIEGFKELSDAYDEGSTAAKKPDLEGEFRRLRGDNLTYWSRRALALTEVAQRLTSSGALPKDVTLEAPYPAIEGPVTVTQLVRVKEGGSISPEDETAAATQAQRKGVDDVLAALAGGGDRGKARAALAAGPVKIDGATLGLYLTRELLTGAAAFDSKHLDEPSKFSAVCDAAEQTLKATEATLKANPNADQEKQAKKLVQDLKAAKKTIAT